MGRSTPGKSGRNYTCAASRTTDTEDGLAAEALEDARRAILRYRDLIFDQVMDS